MFQRQRGDPFLAAFPHRRERGREAVGERPENAGELVGLQKYVSYVF